MLTPLPSPELLLLLLPLPLLLDPSAADWACCAAPLSVTLTDSLWPLCLSSSYASSTLSRPSRGEKMRSLSQASPLFYSHSNILQICSRMGVTVIVLVLCSKAAACAETDLPDLWQSD